MFLALKRMHYCTLNGAAACYYFYDFKLELWRLSETRLRIQTTLSLKNYIVVVDFGQMSLQSKLFLMPNVLIHIFAHVL